MKIKFLIICVLLGVLVSCGSQPKAPQTEPETVDTVNFPEITFDTAVFDFGTILEGEQVSYVFKFQNTGKADLLIQKVETSCGCTVPEYDKKPVKAGENGSIKVRFDSHGKDKVAGVWRQNQSKQPILHAEGCNGENYGYAH